MRRSVVAGVAVAGALALATACGAQQTTRGTARSDGSSSPSPSATTSAADEVASQPWLLRFDEHVGADGEATRTTYVRVTPSAASQLTVTLMPRVEVSQTTNAGESLLVDAAHTWALADARPAPKERSAGTLTLHSLDGAADRTLDVRTLTGDAGLHTDWASFDPAKAGLLRVVSGADVWDVDLVANTAEKSGTIPSRPGWIYGGGFDKNTGQPYIEDTGSFDTDPPGNGDDDTHPAVRAGGQVLDPLADDEYGDKPDPGCEVSAGFVTADDDTVAFCVVGRTLQAKLLPHGSSSWTDVGEPSAAVVPGESDPVFVLPADPDTA